MQKVVPESFEFVPEHGYASLILRRKTDPGPPCTFVTRTRTVTGRLSTCLLIIMLSKNVREPFSDNFNEAWQASRVNQNKFYASP